MHIPPELLIAIASNLNAGDLARFRLVNVACARAGVGLVPQNGVTVLNTASCLRNLHHVLSCPDFANNVRELTLFHGEWPACSRMDWETHPLLFGGNDRSNAGRIRGFSSIEVDKAFHNYEQFIAEEHSRKYQEDLETMRSILEALPRLRTFKITHIEVCAWHPTSNHHYYRLQKKIWLAPYLDHDVSSAVKLFLKASTKTSHQLESLDITGMLNPKALHIPIDFPRFLNIQKLYVSSFTMLRNDGEIQRFLLCFPNIVELSISFLGWGGSIPTVMGQLVWPKLRSVHLVDIWASEQDLFSIFKHHEKSLLCFTLQNAALTQGSWKSLFGRLRSLSSKAQVTARGELYGRRSRDCLYMGESTLLLLAKFMNDPQLPWPFDKLE